MGAYTSRHYFNKVWEVGGIDCLFNLINERDDGDQYITFFLDKQLKIRVYVWDVESDINLADEFEFTYDAEKIRLICKISGLCDTEITITITKNNKLLRTICPFGTDTRLITNLRQALEEKTFPPESLQNITTYLDIINMFKNNPTKSNQPSWIKKI